MKKIILASSSPRRSELLKQIGIDFRVCPSNIEEILDNNVLPEEMVQRLSFDKAKDVALSLEDNERASTLVIGADTIVVNKKMLGKPQDKSQAFEMLKALQGRWHDVITGVTIIDAQNLNHRSAFEKTRVKMRKLSDTEIERYILTGEPMDKAGAYGIQGVGAVLIEKIEGCYFNVVGLPLTRMTMMLKDMGMEVL